MNIAMLASPPMPSTSVDCETKFQVLQSEYEDFVTNSKELEEALEAELADMQEKFDRASLQNATLSSKLESLASQVTSLEKAVSTANSKLEEETKSRLAAELAQDEAESRARQAEASSEVMKDDIDRAHEELAFREAEMEDLREELERNKEQHRRELEEVRSDLEVALCLRNKHSSEDSGCHQSVGQHEEYEVESKVPETSKLENMECGKTNEKRKRRANSTALGRKRRKWWRWWRKTAHDGSFHIPSVGLSCSSLTSEICSEGKKRAKRYQQPQPNI